MFANKIIERINREVGADTKNLHKCKNIVSDYKQRISDIEAKLLIENNNVPSKIKSTLAQCRDVHEAVALETVKIDQFQETLLTKLDEYHEVLHGVSDQLNKIRSLQHLVEYFRILKDIQEVRWAQWTGNCVLRDVVTCLFRISAKVSWQAWKVKMIKRRLACIYHSTGVQTRQTVSSVAWKMSKHTIWNRTPTAWPFIGTMCWRRNFPSKLKWDIQ